jgi:hypothetical protein
VCDSSPVGQQPQDVGAVARAHVRNPHGACIVLMYVTAAAGQGRAARTINGTAPEHVRGGAEECSATPAAASADEAWGLSLIPGRAGSF